MTSTSAFLADRLSELDATALGDLAAFAGVDLKIARRAAAGAPVSSDHALSLFAALGYDPVTRMRIAARHVGVLNRNLLGLLVIGKSMRGVNDRDLAKAMDVSTRVIAAMRKANPVSINNVIKACVYLDIHPFDQCERVREAA